MKDKKLYIFVEGNDDQRFFEKIIKPKFKDKYDDVYITKYKQEKKEKVENLIKSIKARGFNYIYVSDINDSPCVRHKKQKIKKEIKNIDEGKIVIVIKEIESWYLAGLEDNEAKRFGISKKISMTDNLTKEDFNKLMLNKFKKSRIDFQSEVLKVFSIETAKKKNKSFKYFIEKFDC